MWTTHAPDSKTYNFGSSQGSDCPRSLIALVSRNVDGGFLFLKGRVLTCSSPAAYGNMEDKAACFKTREGPGASL